MARSAAPFTQFVKLLQRTAETPACLAGRCRIRTRCSSPRSRSCGRTTSEASGCESPPFPAKTRALIAAKRDAAMPSCPAEFDSARRVRFRPARPARRRAGESRASRLALLALLRRTDGGTRAMLATEQLSKKKSNDCFRRHPPIYPWRRARCRRRWCATSSCTWTGPSSSRTTSAPLLPRASAPVHRHRLRASP